MVVVGVEEEREGMEGRGNFFLWPSGQICAPVDLLNKVINHVLVRLPCFFPFVWEKQTEGNATSKERF